MPNWWNNRLTVVGSKRQVRLFQKTNWDRQLRVKHVELLENSPRRFACQFENQACLLQSLKKLSRRWRRLTFLLDFENEQKRIKGLAKAEAGELEHCEINY